jgi:hypothetical protein
LRKRDPAEAQIFQPVPNGQGGFMSRLLAALVVFVACLASFCRLSNAQTKSWSEEIVPFAEGMERVRLGNKSGRVVVWLGTPVPDGLVRPGKFIPDRLRSDPPKRMASRRIQVWVLKSSGSTLLQVAAPTVPEVGGSSAGWTMESMEFAFENAERSDLVGVVVLADGRLYAREIPSAIGRGR